MQVYLFWYSSVLVWPTYSINSREVTSKGIFANQNFTFTLLYQEFLCSCVFADAQLVRPTTFFNETKRQVQGIFSNPKCPFHGLSQLRTMALWKKCLWVSFSISYFYSIFQYTKEVELQNQSLTSLLHFSILKKLRIELKNLKLQLLQFNYIFNSPI